MNRQEERRSIGRVVWITGLSGAGKSTVANQLVAQLRARGEHAVLLDGDELRAVFGADAVTHENHGRDGRLALARRYGALCSLLASQGLTVVIATISLFHEIHDWNRKNLPGYFEVYLNVSVDELRRRDPKGIYRRYDAGEIRNVSGLDLPIEAPCSPDWQLDANSTQSIDSIVNEILVRLLPGTTGLK